MKDVLLILCVGAAFLAGFPLMKRLDRWLNRCVKPSQEESDAEDAGSPDETGDDAPRR